MKHPLALLCPLSFCYADQIMPLLDALDRGERLTVHGSEFRDALIAGRRMGDAADRILAELVDLGLLRHDPIAQPTHSQGAFFGLSGQSKHPGFVAGCREHFFFRLAPCLDSEPVKG